MSLFNQLERRPVTLFSSEDEGAPQLSPTAGSLKTVLKACLVEGYGSKQGLGWEMLQETATSAVFRSKDPTASGGGIFVENSQLRMAIIQGAYGNEMEKRFYRYGGKCPYLSSGARTGKWRLIGHNKAAFLVVESTYYDRSQGISLMTFFGDFPSVAPADTGNFMLWNGNVSTGSDTNGYISSYQSPPWSIEEQADSWGSLYKSFDGLTISAAARISSLFLGKREIRYPDPITSGLMISEVYLHEFISDGEGHPLRGLWPGLYVCANDLTGKPLFSTLSGFDGTDDEYLMVCMNWYTSGRYGARPFLINTTAWLA